jgi:hypothetical protein
LCGDFKVTLNPQLEVDQYSIPTIEELFSKLRGGKEFSKLDLSMAYQQVLLDEDSKNLTTISTTKGLYRYNRWSSSSPSYFSENYREFVNWVRRGMCFHGRCFNFSKKSGRTHK